ncbi:MAG: IS200/IS605 family element RNA-guided endonuclease TnpB [Oscillospiraceae bacterium]
MEKAYKFRLYPTKEQENLMQRTFGCCRFVFNHFLAQKIEQYKKVGKSDSWVQQGKSLTALKRELEWLKEVDATALQSSIKDLDIAYQNFFRRVRKGEKPGFPKFKSKHNHRKSFKSKRVGNNISVYVDCVKLPKLGLVPAAISKQVEGRVLSATVSQNPSGKYFVSLCCTDVDIPQYAGTGAQIGLDMGLKEFCIASDGASFDNHKHLARSQKRLAKLQRQLSRKTKGSANRAKARIKVARLHERVANQRTDALHKLSTELVKRYDLICIEDLQVKNMVKNHRLAKSISDASWSEFARQLAYKCEWQHKALVRVDKFFPSSQLRSCCGAKNPITKDLGVRGWICPECGTAHDRDVNAAKNILHEGLRLIGA